MMYGFPFGFYVFLLHIYVEQYEGVSGWLNSFFLLQGEDGFPGTKGEMGIKGDRVSLSKMFNVEFILCFLLYKQSCVNFL